MDINQIMTSLEAKHPGESEVLAGCKKKSCFLLRIYTINIRNLRKRP